jgi:hypothetical protein
MLFDLAQSHVTFRINDILKGSTLGCLDKEVRIDEIA